MVNRIGAVVGLILAWYSLAAYINLFDSMIPSLEAFVKSASIYSMMFLGSIVGYGACTLLKYWLDTFSYWIRGY